MEMQTEDNGPKNELMTIQIVNFRRTDPEMVLVSS